MNPATDALGMPPQAPQQHTPGPWRVSGETMDVDAESGTHSLWCGYIGAGRKYRGSVCSIQSCEHIGGIDGAEAKANATLIAAAPDVLAALKLLVAQWNACGPNSEFGRYFRNVREAAIEAIAKAEGK